MLSNGKEYVADDMKSGDMTKEEIKKIHRMFSVNIDETAATLFADLRLMATTIFLTGKLENVGLQMIDKFERNEDGTFKSDTLNQAVGQHASTNRFVAQIKAQLQSALKKHNGDPCVIIKNTDIALVGNPRFNSYGDTFFGGLTFLINDVWAYSVELTNYKKKKIGANIFYQGKFILHLFDHFGLDTPDVQKAYVYGAGFRSWFILQHLNTMGYKPFITQVDLEHTFSGNIKIAPKQVTSKG